MSLTTAIPAFLKPFGGVKAIRCALSDSSSTPQRGFGNKKSSSSKDGKNPAVRKRKSPVNQPNQLRSQAPGLNTRREGSNSGSVYDEIEFEERLKAVRRLADEQKKTDLKKEIAAIDYDAPTVTEEKTIGLGAKIGAGVAVLVFGLLFALGDFLPSGSDSSVKDAAVAKRELPEEAKAVLQGRLKQFEETLSSSPEDPTALEGAAVTLTELGEYTKAASRLEELIKEKPNDPEVYRLQGEVKYQLNDYEGSISAFRRSIDVSKGVNFEALQGLTNALFAAKKPDEAVQVLLASREALKSKASDNPSQQKIPEVESQDVDVDTIQIDLLLGKAYSNWGHISDAVSVYDRLIKSYPEDFRGYLAKMFKSNEGETVVQGIILKENGSAGDAERMFIQARFFAPEKAKTLVDRYSRR